MSSPSCVSHDDSTSICAADASLDIRFAFDMALRARYALPVGQRKRYFCCGAIDSRCLWQHIECKRSAHISNFELREKYIELHCNISTKKKECSETEYWLELIFRKDKISEHTYKDLRNKCGSIRRRLISSITTAKSNQ